MIDQDYFRSNMIVVFIIESSLMGFLYIYFSTLMTFWLQLLTCLKLISWKLASKEFEMKDLEALEKIFGIKSHSNRWEEKLFLSSTEVHRESVRKIWHAQCQTCEDSACYSFFSFSNVFSDQGRREVHVSYFLCKCSWKRNVNYDLHPFQHMQWVLLVGTW